MAIVLLVDDEQGMRLTLGEFLRGEGHEVDAAQDVPEALEYLKNKSYDVVVSDIIMPKMSGTELMRRVRETYPDTQVILITGGPSVDSAAEAVRSGAFDYLTKPVNRNKICEVVGRAFRMKQLAEENHRLDAENKRYRDHLEQMVDLKTRELTEREELFRIITTSAHDTIFMANSEGRITFWNDAAGRLFGYTPQQATGQLYYDLVVQEQHRKTIMEGLKEFAETGTSRVVGKTIEVEGINKNGDIIPLELSLSSINVRGEWHSVAIVRDISLRKQAEHQRQIILETLKESLHGVIHAMSLTVETRDPYTAGHQHRVATIAQNIARRMGLTPDQIEGIGVAGTIHDIGKLSVPAEILSKPGKLSPVEFDIIKQHSLVGHGILNAITLPWPVANTVLQHHERLDGSGYPNGLKGNAISLDARILAVADVVEAISSHRPYRAALGMEAAMAEITGNRNVLYDPVVVDSCVDLHKNGGLGLENDT